MKRSIVLALSQSPEGSTSDFHVHVQAGGQAPGIFMSQSPEGSTSDFHFGVDDGWVEKRDTLVSIPRRVHIRFPRRGHSRHRSSWHGDVSIPRRVHIRFPLWLGNVRVTVPSLVSIPRRVHIRFPQLPS